MTKNVPANPEFAQFASQMARNPHTLAAFQDAMKDAERRSEISERIKALRERRGLTQPQVAERVGVQNRTYQNWEAGGGTSGDNYERLAEVLGVSYDYLVIGESATPPPADILARLARIESVLEQIQGALDLDSDLEAAELEQDEEAASRELSDASGGTTAAPGHEVAK